MYLSNPKLLGGWFCGCMCIGGSLIGMLLLPWTYNVLPADGFWSVGAIMNGGIVVVTLVAPAVGTLFTAQYLVARKLKLTAQDMSVR